MIAQSSGRQRRPPGVFNGPGGEGGKRGRAEGGVEGQVSKPRTSPAGLLQKTFAERSEERRSEEPRREEPRREEQRSKERRNRGVRNGRVRNGRARRQRSTFLRGKLRKR